MIHIPEDIDDPEAWSNAQKLADLLAPVPSPIFTAVVGLWKEHLQCIELNHFTVSRAAYRLAKPIGRFSKLKTPLYFAALKLFPNEMKDMTEDDATKAVLSVLGPGLFAVLLSFIYYHRRLNKLLENKEYWEELSKEIVLNMELGYLVGESLPKLNSTSGVILGGIRYIALATLMLEDATQYQRYRNLNKKKLVIEDEHKRFGCNHSQISGFLLKQIGLIENPLDTGLALRLFGSEEIKDKQLLNWCAGLACIDGIKNSDFPPNDENVKSILSIKQEYVRDVQLSTQKLLDGKTRFDWLLRISQGE